MNRSKSVVTVGELVSSGALLMSDGYRTKRSELDTHGYRIIRAADVGGGTIAFDGDDFVSFERAKQIGEKRGEPGDIILTTKGTVGRVAVVPSLPEPIVYSPQLCFFRVQDSTVVEPRFLYFWFRSREFRAQARNLMDKSDMAPYINLADVRSLRISLPDRGTQKSIAQVLGALDDKIMKNAALIEKAESLAVALAAQASSVIPVRKLAAQRRETVVPQGLTDPLVQHFSLPAFDQARVPEAVGPGSIKSAKFRLSAPAVLISKLNPRFPRVWNVAAMPASPALASTEFVVLEPNTVTTTVLWALLSQPNVARALQSMVAGTSGSHQRVKPEAILAMEIGDPSTLPPGVPEQITAVGERAEAARAENLSLEATRDALLPGLMSGKLRVRDAERVAEEVA